MSKKKIGIILLAIVIVVAGVWLLVTNPFASKQADKISNAELEQIINTQTDKAANDKSKVVQYIAEQNEIKVKEVSYGDKKDITAVCEVKTLDVYKTVSPEYPRFISIDPINKKTGQPYTQTRLRGMFNNDVLELIEQSEPVTREIKITTYQTNEGYFVHTTDSVINTVYGGIVDIREDMEGVVDTLSYKNAEGKTVKIDSTMTNNPRGFATCFEVVYETDEPDTSTYWGRKWNSFAEDFNKNFIQYGRWKTLFTGLGMTLALTFLALILGLVLGFLVAFVRCTYLKMDKPNFLLRFFNGVSQVYLTVIRGTPVVVQVMIIYFVIFMPLGINKFLAAVVCFGLNSGAYVAEIVRGGIMSVDQGQTEAGRSLGFGYMQTMWHIIFPQAFKAVLPALANEFIVLLKETSVAFCIGLGDLMYAGNAIRAATYTAFLPLVTVAVIYLIMVMGFSKLVGLLERRLRKNER